MNVQDICTLYGYKRDTVRVYMNLGIFGEVVLVQDVPHVRRSEVERYIAEGKSLRNKRGHANRMLGCYLSKREGIDHEWFNEDVPCTVTGPRFPNDSSPQDCRNDRFDDQLMARILQRVKLARTTQTNNASCNR